MKPNILYVDDENENLLVFQATYRHLYNVMVALSAKNAIHLMRQVDIAVVIADYKMPEINGIDFLKQCMNEFPDSSRVVLTALNEKEVVLKSINEAQVFHFLTKPWMREEMDRVIQTGVANFELRRKNVELLRDLEKRNSELTEANQEIRQLKSKVERENENLKRELNSEIDTNAIIGSSGSLKDVLRK